MSPRDWDASAYERLSAPIEAMGRDVLGRLELEGDETVLDAGCGTGRVTAALAERLPRGRVIAVDGSRAMVEQARQRLPEAVEVRAADLLELDLPQPVDAIVSTATFHWITDHDRLFARLRAALRPGGTLVAQCGGHGNIARVLEVVGERPGTWLYATPEDTERRLRDAGFTEARAWLQPKPTVPADMETFIAAVILHGQPDARETAARAATQLTELDYVRLNIEATA
jgi:trans-aconitate 2-methyltransferase